MDEVGVESYIRSLVNDRGRSALPTISQIAEYLNDAPYRVRRVCLRLREEGVLQFSRGRGLRAANSVGKRPQMAMSKRCRPMWRLIYHEIRASIAAGDLRDEECLPTVKGYALRRKVSDHTVRAAYRRLVEDGLVYRTGKAFIVGRPPVPAQSPNIRLTRPDVILILHPAEDSWSRIFKSTRTRDFAGAFTAEANRIGIQLLPAYVYPVKHHKLLPCGMTQIERSINSLGIRYRGTLIVGETYEYYRPSQSSNLLLDYIARLCTKEQPVVWFDSIDNLTANTVPEKLKCQIQSLIRTRPVAEHFTRVFMNEKAAVNKAVTVLWIRGHRVFGFVNIRKANIKWAELRKKMIRESLEDLAKGEPFSLHCLNEDAAVDDDRELEILMPLVRCWMADYGVTAWIAPNDKAASLQYLAFRYNNISIPQQTSLLSFDADPSALYPWPVSSVDPGFYSMGHAALHRFVERTVEGRNPSRSTDLPSPCRLNHMGTVGSVPDPVKPEN